MQFLSKILSPIIIPLYGGIWRVKYKLQNSSRPNKILLGSYYHYQESKYGAWIGYRACFRDIPTFPHGIYGIFISADCKIGYETTIFHQVTIGSNQLMDSKGRGSPIIGDRVFIGAGAKIIGNVKVGNNCRIGANAVVCKDIDDNSVVIQAPTRVIKKKQLTNIHK